MVPLNWPVERLPGETVAVVRSAVGRMAESIIVAISAESPVYAEVLSDPAGIGIRLGIEQAIIAFLDAIERGAAPAGDTDELWRRLGEAEFQAGRSLEELRAAFRTGTRGAWRAAAEVADEVGFDTSAVTALAEGIFIYSDALATDVVEGYLRVQSDEAGERERHRRRLVTLLTDPGGPDREALERGAERARWTLPREVAALTLAGDGAPAVLRRLDADVLVGAGPEGSWLLLPDPDGPGRSEALATALQATDASAALGPPVAPEEAARSLRWARRALELIQTGALPDERPTHVRDHLAAMITLSDEGLANLLSVQQLTPLDTLPDGERARLLATLQSWLAHQRHTPSVAEELHVHQQTVRYRVTKLRELLGDRLETAEGRFELELALRARRGLGREPAVTPPW